VVKCKTKSDSKARMGLI